MKPIAKDLTSDSSDQVTNFCACLKLTLQSGRVMGFTSNSTDLSIDGILYKATTGVGFSQVQGSCNFSVDNLEVTCILNTEDILERDLLSGKYDSARVEIFSVDVKTYDRIVERVGYLGEVTVRDGQFVAEIRGLAQRLQCNIGEVYTPTCRATFGDNRCKVDLKNYTFEGKVEASTNRQEFIASGISQESGYFSNGEIKWTSGMNRDSRMEIKDQTGNQFKLVLSMPYDIRVGDAFQAIAGCDKAFTTCCHKFKNAVNYRGEPHIPGADRMQATPSTAADIQKSR